MTDQPLVVVAMSGGVDSSVAAALLLEQGYQVVGMMLRLWSEPGKEESNRCCTPDAMFQARRVAAKLKIPFYAVDVRDHFREVVVQHFLDGYAAGETPNPCLVCNREIRWGFLYEQARALGAEYMATGHYARLRRAPFGQVQLLRGLDSAKDQSYVLSSIPQEKLQHSLFPVGELQKSEVRDIARRLALAPAERPDSQDLCFLAGEDYRDFLGRFAPATLQPGPIINPSGEVIGQHNGLARYTIGQRKDLGLSSQTPLYVIDKTPLNNTLKVGDVSALGCSQLKASELNWVAGHAPDFPLDAAVKIRYKAKEVPAQVELSGNGQVSVQFTHPMRDITPGQRVVFYSDEICLGGGTIGE
jgi:tRNA-specific 2-thiouridylase